jgi:hypothetical protein
VKILGPAESAAAGYSYKVGISPNSGLHVGVDVADKAAIADVQTTGADSDSVTGRGKVAAGYKAYGDVAVAAGIAKERSLTDGRVEVAGGVREGC